MKYSRKTKKELLREQLRIMGEENDYGEIVRQGCVDDMLIDDSFANVLRLMFTAKGTDEEEELMIALYFTREKLRRMMQ